MRTGGRVSRFLQLQAPDIFQKTDADLEMWQKDCGRGKEQRHKRELRQQ